jgi:membrane protease YdiL (CAAX protease family)
MLGAGLLVTLAATAIAAASGNNAVALLADPKRSPLLTNPTWIALGTLTSELAVGGVLIGALLVLKPPLSLVLPRTRPHFVSVVGAVLLVFGLAPLADVVAELCRRLTGTELTATKIVATAARGAGPFGLVLLLISLVVLPALVEESLFRGFVTAAFAKSWAMALIVPSVLFGVFHLEPTQAAGTIVLGLGFGAARLLTGSIVAGVITHFVYNGAIILFVRFSSAGPDYSIELMPVLVGLAIAGIGLLLLVRERSATTG